MTSKLKVWEWHPRKR